MPGEDIVQIEPVLGGANKYEADLYPLGVPLTGGTSLFGGKVTLFSTAYGSIGDRNLVTAYGSATSAVGQNGIVLDTTTTTESPVLVDSVLGVKNPYAGNPIFGCSFKFTESTAANNMHGVLGVLTNPIELVDHGVVYTTAGYGFKFIKESGTWNLYGWTGSGTSSSTTLLMTLTESVDYTVIAAMTSGAGVKYYVITGTDPLTQYGALSNTADLPATSLTTGRNLMCVSNYTTTGRILLTVYYSFYMR